MSISLGARVWAIDPAGINSDPIRTYGFGTYLGDLPRPGTDGPVGQPEYAMLERAIRRHDADDSMERNIRAWYEQQVADGAKTREEADLVLEFADRRRAETLATPMADRVAGLHRSLSLNPKILLEQGGVVWGYECWWGEVDDDATEPPERFVNGRQVELIPAPHPPERVQRSRQRGSHLPAGVVSVGRPTRWGNPFRVGDTVPRFWVDGGIADDPDTTIHIADATVAVDLYRRLLARSPEFVAEIRAELRGKNLACWCAPAAPCHGDVLLRVAEGATP